MAMMTSPEHDSAVQRLDLEQVKYDRLRESYEGAIGTVAESGCHGRLGAAGDRVAAREAWLRWIDEDSYRGLNAGPFELLAEQPSPGMGSDRLVGRTERVSQRKSPRDVQARGAEERDVRRTRRLSRAVEAFQYERRWLGRLRDR
jgi:hypothetical protein